MEFTADNMPWGCYLVFLGFVFSVSLEDKCIFKQKINPLSFTIGNLPEI
jgi:hypothetical protein